MWTYARRIRFGRGLALYREHRMWMLDVQLPNGKRLRESMHSESLLFAMAKMQDRLGEEWPEFLTYTKAHQDSVLKDAIERGALQPYYPSGEEIGEIVAARLGKQTAAPDKIAIARARDEFVAAKQGDGIKSSWKANLTRQINFFAAWSKVATLDQITPIMLGEYKTHVRTVENLMDDAVRQKSSILKDFLGWAVEVGYLTKNPASGLKIGKISRRSITIYTRKELRGILKHARASSRKLDLLISIGLFTGMRRAEIVERLNWEDVDVVQRRIRVRNTTEERTKTPEGGRVIPVFDELLAAFKRFGKAKTGRIFPVKDLRNVSRDVQAVIRKALEVPKRRDGLGNLRHTFATLVCEHSVAAARVRQWLGHTEGLQTLERHYAGAWQGELFPLHWRGRQLSPKNMPRF